MTEPTDYDELESTTELFSPGEVLVTLSASLEINDLDLVQALFRHCAGDWGEECTPEQRQANEAGRHGSGVLRSTFRDRNGNRFHFVTTAARSLTVAMVDAGDRLRSPVF